MRHSRVMEFLKQRLDNMDVAYSWKQTEGKGRKEDETLQSNGVPETRMDYIDVAYSWETRNLNGLS